MRRRLQDKVGVPAECSRILSGVSLVLRDLQEGASGRLLMLPGAFRTLPGAF